MYGLTARKPACKDFKQDLHHMQHLCFLQPYRLNNLPPGHCTAIEAYLLGIVLCSLLCIKSQQLCQQKNWHGKPGGAQGVAVGTCCLVPDVSRCCVGCILRTRKCSHCRVAAGRVCKATHEDPVHGCSCPTQMCCVVAQLHAALARVPSRAITLTKVCE